MFVSFVLMSLVVFTTIVLGIIFNNKRVMERVNSPVKVGKRTLGINMVSLFSFMTFAILSLIPDGHAFAATTSSVATSVTANINHGLPYIGAGLSTGLAAMGAGIGVGIAGASGIGAVSEKPDMLGRTLIYVGLAEGVAIYGLIISIMILGRV